jgi:transcription elongation GreA/GreB family factor
MLVYPEEAVSEPTHLSVMTPLGVALLGLRPGDAVVYSRDDGAELYVAVLDVVCGSQKSEQPPGRQHFTFPTNVGG